MSIFYEHLCTQATNAPTAPAWSADDVPYNYAELRQAVDETAATLAKNRQPLPIHTASVTEQWLRFLPGWQSDGDRSSAIPT